MLLNLKFSVVIHFLNFWWYPSSQDHRCSPSKTPGGHVASFWPDSPLENMADCQSRVLEYVNARGWGGRPRSPDHPFCQRLLQLWLGHRGTPQASTLEASYHCDVPLWPWEKPDPRSAISRAMRCGIRNLARVWVSCLHGLPQSYMLVHSGTAGRGKGGKNLFTLGLTQTMPPLQFLCWW